MRSVKTTAFIKHFRAGSENNFVPLIRQPAKILCLNLQDCCTPACYSMDNIVHVLYYPWLYSYQCKKNSSTHLAILTEKR